MSAAIAPSEAHMASLPRSVPFPRSRQQPAPQGFAPSPNVPAACNPFPLQPFAGMRAPVQQQQGFVAAPGQYGASGFGQRPQSPLVVAGGVNAVVPFADTPADRPATRPPTPSDVTASMEAQQQFYAMPPQGFYDHIAYGQMPAQFHMMPFQQQQQQDARRTSRGSRSSQQFSGSFAQPRGLVVKQDPANLSAESCQQFNEASASVSVSIQGPGSPAHMTSASASQALDFYTMCSSAASPATALPPVGTETSDPASVTPKRQRRRSKAGATPPRGESPGARTTPNGAPAHASKAIGCSLNLAAAVLTLADAAVVPAFATEKVQEAIRLAESAKEECRVPVIAERFRTRECRNFTERGACPYGQRCMFAHGKQELRTVDMNLTDGLVSDDAVRMFLRSACAAARAAAAGHALPPVPAAVPVVGVSAVPAALMDAGNLTAMRQPTVGIVTDSPQPPPQRSTASSGLAAAFAACSSSQPSAQLKSQPFNGAFNSRTSLPAQQGGSVRMNNPYGPK